ncbi:MAG: tetraacyldisaccharide 4'-kinase [Spirochaetes bacterium]|nr:tetraacyldisaccharide 4'-kinase [Spirochaetota bacterium]
MNSRVIYKYIRFIFIPLIPVYLLAFYLKKFFSTPVTFSIPVICVGNITTGGAGKTPAVIELAKLFKDMGLSPGIVSRGYRGSRSREGAIVTDGSAIFISPRESGDESYLIACSLTDVPVAICTDRVKAIRSLLDAFKVDIVLMDDGFQNNSVHRDINIIIIDAVNPFGNGLMLPAGDLREPRISLRRSDIIFINKWDLITNNELDVLTKKVKKITGDKNLFYSGYHIEDLLQVNNLNNKLSIEQIKNKNILIVSGIGNPEGFRKSILGLKPASMKHIVYPDHFNYSLREIKKIVIKAENYDFVITTEKDYMKIRDFHLTEKFYLLKISFRIKDVAIFEKCIDSYLKKIKNNKHV